MTKEEAYKIVENICANFRGTRQEHQLIQQALAILNGEEDEQSSEKVTKKS